MKKQIISIFIALFALGTVAAAAGSALIPVPYTGEDGVTRWGYLDESGAQRVGFFYDEAEPFNEYGFAVVKNAGGEVGVIGSTGEPVIACRAAPRTVDFSQNAIAFRYAEKSVYFNDAGEQTGEYIGAAGFFENGLLRVQRGGRWGYVDASDTLVIPARYAEAGDFADGSALAKNMDGTWCKLRTNGVRSGLPGEPAQLRVGLGSVVVLRDEAGYRLFSLATGAYLTQPYEQMQLNDDGYIMVQQDKKWGILSASGKISVPLQYFYLAYMGEGAYAARGAKGTAAEAIDGSGARIYRTDTYVGGFESFRFGQSWHGTMDGGVVFFNKNGVLSRKISGASKPVILSENVARMTIAGETNYIRLSDGKVLYAPIRAYTLAGGVKITTKTYEKYLGMQPDGTEYGWRLEYPQFSGMKDLAAQAKINSAIEKFFLDGPSLPAQKQSLVGSYGFAFVGRVLVVNVDAQLGVGVGATIWNDNIALDFGSGAVYTVTGDLLRGRFEDAVIARLPQGTPYYRYSYPRITADGVVYYLNYAQTIDAPAFAQAVKVYYSDIWSVVNTEGACYRAMTSGNTAAPKQTFSDVPATYWASGDIAAVYARGLMQGSGGRFRPEESIVQSEAVVTLARALQLPAGSAPTATNAWYAAEYGGAYEAGLLAGLADTPEAALTRADAMQLFAAALRHEKPAPKLTEAEQKTVLAPFSDAAALAPARRETAAYCVKRGVVHGDAGKLQPGARLTRAEFAKLLTAIL